MCIEIPQERVTKAELASIVGKIISMGLAIGPVSRFMTLSMYSLLETRDTWYDLLEISDDAHHELEFWKACLAEYSSQPIWQVPSAVRVVYLDASESGYGGYVVEHGGCVSYGQWTESEAGQSYLEGASSCATGPLRGSQEIN